MKVTVNLPEKAIKLADEGAARLCVSRSAYISIAIAEKAKQDTVTETLPELLAAVRELQQVAAQTQTADGTQTQTDGDTVHDD